LAGAMWDCRRAFVYDQEVAPTIDNAIDCARSAPESTVFLTDSGDNVTAGAPGDVVEIPFANPSSITHIGLGSLPLPGGIALGPDSAMYVAVGAPDTAPASGGVIKVSAG